MFSYVLTETGSNSVRMLTYRLKMALNEPKHVGNLYNQSIQLCTINVS
jgi:hypothetical protein